MLHLMKLAVGIRDLAQLRAAQAPREPLRHLTRNHPRRAAEVLAGGSIYWVIAGAMLARQRILDLQPDQADDGTPRCALMLDRTLVPVAARPVKPFQGWRYLPPADAPADVDDALAGDLPPSLAQELRLLGLL